jgi:hypothetical protein
LALGIALVWRDLGWPAKAFDAARASLEQHGGCVNAAHARHLDVRRLLLIRRLDEAERALAELDPTPFPPLRAVPVSKSRQLPRADYRVKLNRIVRETSMRDAAMPGRKGGSCAPRIISSRPASRSAYPVLA